MIDMHKPHPLQRLLVQTSNELDTKRLGNPDGQQHRIVERRYDLAYRNSR